MESHSFLPWHLCSWRCVLVGFVYLGYAAGFGGYVIKNWSSVPAFKKQIMELNRGNTTGYLWRRRADHNNLLYCDGKVIGQAKSTTELLGMVRDHAKRTGEWFEPELVAHYMHNSEGLWRLYIDGRYAKKSRDKKELQDYVVIYSWMRQSGRCESWGNKK